MVGQEGGDELCSSRHTSSARHSARQERSLVELPGHGNQKIKIEVAPEIKPRMVPRRRKNLAGVIVASFLLFPCKKRTAALLMNLRLSLEQQSKTICRCMHITQQSTSEDIGRIKPILLRYRLSNGRAECTLTI